jgi:hypothetical protein
MRPVDHRVMVALADGPVPILIWTCPAQTCKYCTFTWPQQRALLVLFPGSVDSRGWTLTIYAPETLVQFRSRKQFPSTKSTSVIPTLRLRAPANTNRRARQPSTLARLLTDPALYRDLCSGGAQGCARGAPGALPWSSCFLST